MSDKTKSSIDELNELMEKFLKENDLDATSVFLWVTRKGYVIVTEDEYDNLEVIDENGAVP